MTPEQALRHAHAELSNVSESIHIALTAVEHALLEIGEDLASVVADPIERNEPPKE